MCVILHMSVITQEGASALMVAAYEGKTEAVVELVKAGANVDMQTKVCQYFCTRYTLTLSILCFGDLIFVCIYMYM